MKKRKRTLQKVEMAITGSQSKGKVGEQARYIARKIASLFASDFSDLGVYDSHAIGQAELGVLMNQLDPDALRFSGVSQTIRSTSYIDKAPSFEHEQPHIQSEQQDVLRQISEIRLQSLALEQDLQSKMSRIEELTIALSGIQGALIKRTHGELVIHEMNSGFVSTIIDDDATIVYNTPYGPLEQLYDKSQFIGNTTPRPGDQLEVHCFGWIIPRVSKGIANYLTAEEQEQFKNAGAKNETGPIEI